MQILISDANVLIDMDKGGLLELMFALPFVFKVSDMLYRDELAAHHPHLPQLGLQLTELAPEGMLDAMRMAATYTGPSRYDCFCMALARQENCPLLTGDKDLRKAAEREAVVVKGTIWLVEQLVIHNQIDKARARSAYHAIKIAGSRLPWELALARLDGIDGG